VANLAQLIAELDAGGFLARTNDTLAEALAAVKRTRKQASITVKLAVEAAGFDADGIVNQVSVTATVAGKLPETPTPAATYFFGESGGLQKRDPRQPCLPVVGDGSETAPAAARSKTA